MKGMYEIGGSLCGLGLGASTPKRSMCVEKPTSVVLDADPGNPDSYVHPSTHWSPANPNGDAVADSNFGTDYARRGVYRDRGSTPRNPCLGRQWAFDLGGYRQTRRGPGKPARTFLPALVRQEV